MTIEIMKQQTGSKSEKEYVKAVYCHPTYLTYMQSTNTGLDEAQTGIKIAGRNINNLRYTDAAAAAAAVAKSLQLCPTLCNPIDGSPLGSSVPGIFQARVLEWDAITFSLKYPTYKLNK